MRLNLVVAAAAIAVLIAILHAGPPGAHAAGSTMYGSGASERLLRQMDTDKNGTVSRHEFLQFVSRKFEALDTNRNGRLERNELRPLAGSTWVGTRARPR